MMRRLKEPAVYEQTFLFEGQRANQANIVWALMLIRLFTGSFKKIAVLSNGYFSGSVWTVLNPLLPKSQHANREGCQTHQMSALFGPP